MVVVVAQRKLQCKVLHEVVVGIQTKHPDETSFTFTIY